MVETTRYFRENVLQKRPYIQLEWCAAALEHPIRREVQPGDGRIRHWIWIAELGRYLRGGDVAGRHDGPQRLSRQEVYAVRLNYDPATDSLYIHLAERASADSDEVSPGVVLDYDAAGVLVGIDIQNASLSTEIDRLVAEHLPLKTLNAA